MQSAHVTIALLLSSHVKKVTFYGIVHSNSISRHMEVLISFFFLCLLRICCTYVLTYLAHQKIISFLKNN